MRGRHSVAHRRSRSDHEEAAEHMRQRRELSRLVHGIDNDVLDLFYKLESSRFERLADTYSHLFGRSAEQYMRDTRVTWQSGRIGVSGKNAARIMMVLPHFLSDEQRNLLLSKLRPIIGADQIKAWLEGLDSTVRNEIKVIAEPQRGVSLPSSAPRRTASTPALPPSSKARSFVMDAVVSPVVPPSAQAPPAPPPNYESKTGVIITVFAICGFILLVAANQHPSTNANRSVNPVTRPTTVTPPTFAAAPAATVRPAPTPFPLEVKFFRRTKGNNGGAAVDTIGGTNADGSLWSLSVSDAIAGIRSGNYSFYVLRNRAASEVDVVADGTGTAVLKIVGETSRKPGVLDLPDFPATRPTPQMKAVPTSAASTIWSEQRSTSSATTQTYPFAQPTAGASSSEKAAVRVNRPLTPYMHVEGYTRADGTYVGPHDRTRADSTTSDNWSEKGNINPITGKPGSSRR